MCLDRADKPGSVVGDHLSRSSVALGLKRHSALAGGTALHAGKDLVVAPLSRDRIIPLGNLIAFAQSVTVGTSVLADDGRYPRRPFGVGAPTFTSEPLPSSSVCTEDMPGLSSPCQHL